jgi:hypothetical protein
MEERASQEERSFDDHDPNGEAGHGGGGAGAGDSGSHSEWPHDEEPTALEAIMEWAGELFAQASDVIWRPGEFFEELPEEGGLGRATVFAIVMGAVAGVLGFVLRVLPPLSAVFTSPFAAFAYTVVGAFLIHVLAMVTGGKGALDGSYRLAAYLTVFFPLVIVAGFFPYLSVAMAGYGVYVLIQGVIPIHGLDERRAWSVFGGVGAIGLLVLLVGGPGRNASFDAELRKLRAQQQRVVQALEDRIEEIRKDR